MKVKFIHFLCFVSKRVHDLKKIAEGLKVAPGDDEDASLGPVISKES